MTDRKKRFEAAALPHLDAAYNLARWLLRDDQNARDVVQEAYLRAFRFFDGFNGDDARPWLLRIVRNASYSWLHDSGRYTHSVEFDEERHSQEQVSDVAQDRDNPEYLLLQKIETGRVDAVIEKLPLAFREVLILREMDEMSYEQIARIVAIPVGTVMSRLARARALLRATLSAQSKER